MLRSIVYFIVVYILIAVGVLTVIIVVGGALRTWGLQDSAMQRQFLKGIVPEELPDGEYTGKTSFLNFSWKSKRFYKDQQKGSNVFRHDFDLLEEEKYPFTVSVNEGLVDTFKKVIKLDYNLSENPWWVQMASDELVQTQDGVLLGKMYYKLIPGFPFILQFFTLEKKQ